MGFSIESSIPVFTVFLQGILSFFSPCVLPLIPLYIGYLSGGTKTIDENGVIRYERKKVIINTLCFIIGISFAFFILGFGFTSIGKFFSGNRTMFAKIGGIVVIIFGMFQLGVFSSNVLNKEHRLPFRLNSIAMNPLTALIMGFTFSFAWTPCVGPALASVLLMASSANSSAQGFILIGVYTVGFVILFIAVGLFTGSLLEFFKKYQNLVKYTVKIGGVLMILMGIMMFTGWMNNVTSYLSNFGGNGSNSPKTPPIETQKEDDNTEEAETSEIETSNDNDNDAENIPAPDFTLTDQYGNEHTLSDYKGKVVFLNFWATWCGPCKQEMPDIQAIYEKYGNNENDLIVLGIANPKTDESPYNQDIPVEGITEFLSKGGYSYPVVMDTTGEIFSEYGVMAFPTTFMIDKEGNLFGYATGTLTNDIMESIIKQTMEGKRSTDVK